MTWCDTRTKTNGAASDAMRLLAMTALFVSAAFAGCIGADADDEGYDAPEEGPGRLSRHAVPHDGPGTAFGALSSHNMQAVGQGIWIEDGLLYGTDGSSLAITDVSDPADPVDIGFLGDVGARDVDVLEWDGVLYAVLAGSARGMHFVDVTDPTDPVLVMTHETEVGVHNLASVPGTPYVYVSGADGPPGSARIEVVDITDIDFPVSHFFAVPAEWDGVATNTDGCHDITVRVDLGRAYCAGGGGQYQTGGGETWIWDITPEAGGPLDPTWLGMMDDDRVVYNHQAMVNDDGTILIVDDENLGPNCFSADLPGMSSLDDPKVPTGAAWIWDISDETAPVLKGLVQQSTVDQFLAKNDPFGLAGAANCGSHFGDIIPGTTSFIMGWYGGGTILVDYSDPENPTIVDSIVTDSSTWDAQYHAGHVFASSGALQIAELI